MAWGYGIVNFDRVNTVAKGSYGALFTGDGSTMTMNGGSFIATQGTALGIVGSNNTFNVINGTIMGADRLAYVYDSGTFAYNTMLFFEADNSKLFGGAMVEKRSKLAMNLQNGTQWTLKGGIWDNISATTYLTIDDSLVHFTVPTGNPTDTDSYQRLIIGREGDGIYDAIGNARVEHNIYLNEGGVDNQFTDRLLIDGDVYGKTLVTINTVTGSPGGLTSPSGAYLNNEGISIIQVTGNAAEDSFVLAGGYVALGAQPYIYKLYAYGPGSSNGAANKDETDHRFGYLGGEFGNMRWDYRLQSILQSSGGGGPPVREVPPQISNYLTAPLALFKAGLLDISTLHQRLGEIRYQAESEQDGRGGNFFLRGYGGDYKYRSNRSVAQYGYDAYINYAALQAGGNLYGLEREGNQWLFGLAGASGDLSFKPQHSWGTHKTSLKRWSAAAYATWLHDEGAYADLVMSYGGFGGTVSAPLRGPTSRLKGNHFAASVEVGKPYPLQREGWSIEPQGQLVYQRLDFSRVRDVDGFPIDISRPEQWIGRLGARLKKQVATKKVEKALLYGKLSIIHGLNGGHAAWLGDTFSTGKFGSQIEAGLGANVDLNQKATLYGDIAWANSASGSGGIRGLTLNLGARTEF